MNRRRFLLDALRVSTLVTSSAWLAGTARAACAAFGHTRAQTEGPYYKINPPQRAFFREPGTTGDPLSVSGRVLNEQCRPLANVKVDFWHADASGEYDNAGYHLRGFQLTDAEGRFRLQTILPGVYTGRTRHIHVKITPPKGRTLTTQLYFPGEPANVGDGLFDPELLMKMGKVEGEQTGQYDFVIQT